MLVWSLSICAGSKCAWAQDVALEQTTRIQQFKKCLSSLFYPLFFSLFLPLILSPKTLDFLTQNTFHFSKIRPRFLTKKWRIHEDLIFWLIGYFIVWRNLNKALLSCLILEVMNSSSPSILSFIDRFVVFSLYKYKIYIFKHIVINHEIGDLGFKVLGFICWAMNLGV